MLRVICRKLLLSILFAALLLSAVICIAITQMGLNWIVAGLDIWLGQHLQLTTVQGKLIGPITVGKLQYRVDNFALTANNLQLDWDIRGLLDGRLHITRLVASSVVLQQYHESQAAELALPHLPQNFTLPLKVQLDFGNLYHFHWQVFTASKLSQQELIDVITLQAMLLDKTHWQIHLKLLAQNNFLLCDGGINNIWQLHWQAHIAKSKQNLALFYGVFDSVGKIVGAFAAPKIDILNNAVNFGFVDNYVKQLQNTIIGDLAQNKLLFIRLTATVIKIRKFAIDKLVINGDVDFKQFGHYSTRIAFAPFTLSTPLTAPWHKIYIRQITAVVTQNVHAITTQLALVFVKMPVLHVEFTTTPGQQAIAGTLQWQNLSLATLRYFVPNLNGLAGNLSVQQQLSGTWQQPQLAGTITLDNGAIAIPQAGLTLRNIQARIRNVGHELNFAIKLTSAALLNLTGKLNFIDAHNIVGDASIVGDKILVTNIPGYEIYISPQLKLQLQRQRCDVVGSVLIPSATINPHNFSSSVTLPRETVFVSEQKNNAKLMNLPIFSQVKLLLGDDVKVDLMNIKGKVAGQLQLSDQPQRTTTAYGNFTLRDGTYNILGQGLKITSAILSFNGTELQNPSLYMQATREIQAAQIPVSSGIFTPSGTQSRTLTVGLQAKGKLDNLQTTLFSVPGGLAQTDIFSYLVLGQSSGSASGDKMGLLFKAATAMNMGGAGEVVGLVDDLRKNLGLSELTLGSETVLDQAKSDSANNATGKNNTTTAATTTSPALILGKYLSPRLYIGYSLGLANTVNVLRVRYILSNNWSLRSESSSDGNGADLVYTVER